jgi:4-amino-4-deoxy-L-arabinose transferase-like glycosyltransferase
VERLAGSDEDVGDPGPLRLLNPQLGGQIGWLLVALAVVGLVAATWHSWQRHPHLPLSHREDQALLLWATWLVSLLLFFSVAGDWDPHYLAMLSPAVAALVGVGVVALWDDYRSPARRGWLLPLVLVGSASIQLHILAQYPEWRRWLAPTIVILCLAAAASLVVARLTPQLKGSGLPLGAISLGVGSLLLAPSIWAVSTVWYGAETRSPTAGPQAEASELSSRFGSEGSEVAPLVEYLEANQGDAEYLVAAIRSRIASPIILNTDEPVISLGGFNGADPVFSNERLAGLVREGAVRYFLIEGRDREEKSVRWIRENCEHVRQEMGQSSDSTVLLYDCSATELVESGNPSSKST